MLIYSTDKARLARHFQKDLVLFAYHLGDLDDFFFPYCQFACKYHPTRAIIEEVALIYTGSKIPTVLMFGLTDTFAELMNNLIDLLPPRFEAHFQDSTGEILASRYQIRDSGDFLRMKLESYSEMEAPLPDNCEIINLNADRLKELDSFYKKAHPGNYFIDRMIETGNYFGIVSDDRLLSVAGVHVCSDEYDIAVLGNIATDPDHRGRGMSTAVTAHLVQKLSKEGKTICLNVSANNAAAIVVYEKLGFVKADEYRAGICELK